MKPATMPALRRDDGGMDLRADGVAQLGFVYLEVSTHKRDDVAVVRVALVDDRLAGGVVRLMQIACDFLDGRHLRRGHEGDASTAPSAELSTTLAQASMFALKSHSCHR